MTPTTRQRTPFELLRFTATPVTAELALLEVEGRFAGQRGRFGRRPLLVVETGAGEPRELAPVRDAADDECWTGTFVAPIGAAGGGSFALAVRGTLLDLPAPDLLGNGDRLAALAREANLLRREIETLEAERDAAAAQARAVREERDAAVTEARETAEATAAQRIAALEEELDTAHRVAAADAAQAREAADAERLAAVQELERRVQEAEDRAAARAAGVDVLRAELAEEREQSLATIADLQGRLDDALALAAAGPPPPDPPTQVIEPWTEVTAVRPPAEEREPTQPQPLRLGEHTPVTELPHRHEPHLSPWVAVVALVVVVVLVVGLLAGLLS